MNNIPLGAKYLAMQDGADKIGKKHLLKAISCSDISDDESIQSILKKYKFKNSLFSNLFTINPFDESNIKKAENYKPMDYSDEAEEISIYIIYTKDFDQFTNDYLTSLQKLCQHYFGIHKLDEAKQICVKGLSITALFCSKNPNSVLWLYNHHTFLEILSFYYMQTGEDDKILEIKNESTDILKKLYIAMPNKFTKIYIESLDSLSSYYEEIGNLHKAIDIESENLNVIKENPDKELLMSYMTSLTKLAGFYAKASNTRKSVEIQCELVEVLGEFYLALPNVYASTYVATLNTLAASYNKLDDMYSAMKTIKKLLELWTELLPQDAKKWREEYFRTNRIAAHTFEKQNNIDRAIDFAKRALGILQSLYDENPTKWDTEYTDYLLYLGSLYDTRNTNQT